MSTAITKDGQTTTTARIPFAAGINSSLTTDSTSSSTGSIITSGGVGIAKALYVGTTANIAGTTNLAGLTASSAVATDASKNLVSVTNTGTGNNVLATSPTLVTPILGTPASGSLVNCTDINYTGFKNRIINGAMVIDQRNAGAASANTINGYFLDRWNVTQSTTGKVIAQQNAGSVTPPAGFSNYLGVTSQSAYSVTSTDFFLIFQPIEGFNTADFAWGTASASTVTLSFWVRSSLTGNFGAAIKNSAANRSYPFSYTISSANTWEQKSVTIAGDTTGTWIGATNGIGLYVLFSLGSGSTRLGTANVWAAANYDAPTGSTSVVGTNGATFYITGVQLEKGSTATSFDYRPYGTELALCQRYLPCFNFSAANGSLGSGFASATTSALINCVFPVQVRTPATGILVTGSFNAYTVAGGNSGNFTSIALAAGQSAYSGALNCTGGTGLLAAQGTFLLSPAGNSQIQFTGCEL
ncbi:MAG: hypothetical protein EBR60_02185 [Burkholderiaceae bacterium]|nr:hypothetical protein [Burkholderiaceae bacterium]